MSSFLFSSDNEIHFLRTIRQELDPDAASPRRRDDFSQIFKSRDDRLIHQNIASRQDIDFQGLISSFQDNAILLQLQVHVADNFQDAGEIIIRIAKKSEPEFGNQKHITQHFHPDLQSLQLWQKLAEDSIALHTTYPGDPELIDKTKASYIGITMADWAVAESSTLIQLTSPERPRSTSLIPSIHIGVVRQTNLLASLTEGYTMLRRVQIPTSFTFISGPSKTADIEAHMVHGAHGPREMHVVIVKDSPHGITSE